MENSAPRTSAKPVKYTSATRTVLTVVVVLLMVVGIAQDPAGFGKTLLEVPVAFANAFIWVALTLLVVWLFVDLMAKHLIGKSLRELLNDRSQHFEENLVCALVIVIAIAFLIAK